MNAFYPLCLAVLLLFSGFSKTFAQTFVGQGGLPFPPGAPAQTVGNTTSVAVVSGVGALGACLQIDNVTIDLEHTWVGDIALFLISPSGTVLELSSGNGGSGDNYQVTTFSDAAFAFITAGAPPFNGGFWPEGRQQDTNCFCPNANAQGGIENKEFGYYVRHPGPSPEFFQWALEMKLKLIYFMLIVINLFRNF